MFTWCPGNGSTLATPLRKTNRQTDTYMSHFLPMSSGRNANIYVLPAQLRSNLARFVYINKSQAGEIHTTMTIYPRFSTPREKAAFSQRDTDKNPT